jgi:hypothetical protein
MPRREKMACKLSWGMENRVNWRFGPKKILDERLYKGLS